MLNIIYPCSSLCNIFPFFFGGINNGEAVLKLHLGKLITTGMMFTIDFTWESGDNVKNRLETLL